MELEIADHIHQQGSFAPRWCWRAFHRWAKVQEASLWPDIPGMTSSTWFNLMKNPWSLCCQNDAASSMCGIVDRPVCCFGGARNITNADTWIVRQIRRDMRQHLRTDGSLHNHLTLPNVHKYYVRSNISACLFRLGQLESAVISIKRHCRGEVVAAESAFRIQTITLALHILNGIGVLRTLVPSHGLAFLFAYEPLIDIDRFPVPVFIEARPVFQQNSILFPPFQTFLDHTEKRHRQIIGHASKVPWESRAPRLFWRGSLRPSTRCPCGRNSRLDGLGRFVSSLNHSWGATNLEDRRMREIGSSCCCGIYSISEKHVALERKRQSFIVHRIAVSNISRRFPFLVDAGVMFGDSVANKFNNRSAWRQWFKPGGSDIDHIGHKYLLSVDGGQMDSQRLWIFITGSLVFKQVTTLVDLTYGSMVLRPFEHFIPVREDFSDLISRLEWARANDEISHRIARAGQKLAFERLGTRVAGIKYLHGALKEYAKLFTP